MANEQKLREALQEVIAYARESGHDWLCLTEAEQALTTTEPEPTGIPEVKPWDHPEPQTMRWSDLEIRWIQSYGKQCWKAGYKHGAWDDKPAVNQQLTTDPLDEREAFEREMKKRLTSPLSFDRHEANTNEYAYLTTAVAWYAWQARAAMAQVSDINVVESFTNDTKDAKRYRWLRDDTDSDWAICEWSHDPGDEGYYRDARAPHIVDAAIDAAMAQGVRG